MAEYKKTSELTEKAAIADNDFYVGIKTTDSETMKINHSVVKADIQDITSLDEKLSIAADDLYLINNSASADAPNGVKHSTISANIEAAAVATAQDIDSLTEKTSIADNDTLMINNSENAGAVEKIKAELLKYSPGYFTGNGIYFTTPNILLAPYVIEANGVIYSSTSAVEVVDLTGQTANTWYAVVLREDSGAISSVALGAGWDNLTISGNQLNMASIYDPAKNYCRDSRTAVFYRVLGVYKVNATSAGVGHILQTKNLPKSIVAAAHTAGQVIPDGSNTSVHYETISTDLNSNVTVGASPSWEYTAKKTELIQVSAGAAFVDSNAWTQGESASLSIWKNGVLFKRLQFKEIQTTFNGHQLMLYGSLNLDLNVGDEIYASIFQNTGGTLALGILAVNSYINIVEI